MANMANIAPETLTWGNVTPLEAMVGSPVSLSSPESPRAANFGRP
jgi:hypothetical protein